MSHSTIRCSTCRPTRWIRRSRARTTGRCWTSWSTPVRRCRWVPCWHASGRRARRWPDRRATATAAGPADAGSPRAAIRQTVAAPVTRDGAGGRLLSPLVRRLAAEHGIDVTTVPGTGVGGRIRREDIENAIAAGPTTAAAPAAAPAATPAAPRATKAATDGRDEVVPLSRMRLILADTLKASQTLAASVWTSVEVDFDNVERVRTEYKARFKKETGASLSYLPFISRAVCDALRAFPTVNSSIDLESKTMTLHPYVNLGVAVDLDEQGLVVPVVKDADTLNIRGIASADRHEGGGGTSKGTAQQGDAGFDVHDHEPRTLCQLRFVADHQPAERRDPVHRRCEAPPRRRR